MDEKLKIFLDKKVDEFNQPFFIEHDPICIPHSFSKKQDIEIAKKEFLVHHLIDKNETRKIYESSHS